MGLNKNIFLKGKKINLHQALVLICSILLVVYFMPRDSKFNYHFNLNTPWGYGQIIATFDFPISKSPEQQLWETDSIYSHFSPYFDKDSAKGEFLLEKFKKTYDLDFNKFISHTQYLKYRKQLSTIYEKGIISFSNIEQLRRDSVKIIKIITNNRATAVTLNSILSEKGAYELLTKGDTLSPATQKILKLEEFLTPNLIYDSIKSAHSLEEQLSNLSQCIGMVQKGQKIISRGEIVDEKSYQILRSLREEWNKRLSDNGQTGWILLGQILYVSLVLFSLLYYIYVYKPEHFNNLNKIILIYILIAIFAITVGIMAQFRIGNVFMLPFAIVPLLITVFLDSNTAFVSHVALVLVASVMLTYPYDFVLLQIIAGFIAILSLRDLSERYQLFKAVFFIFSTYIICFFSYELILENDLSKLNVSMYLYFIISCILLLFTLPFMFIIEKLFGFTSGVTLIELSNINNKLLQQLSQEAPGTFQHSMQVGNLAAEAARAIGANSLEVRAGALYHDIGKLTNPIYFTENQSGGINPHNKLSPTESAEIIIRHVTDGLRLAEKNHLPKSIRRFIASHHGLSQTYYFYITYKNQHANEEIDEAPFTYPGPNPATKEEAILMMADSVEAASHSLNEYTEININNLVEKIIDTQLSKGLFSKSPLTFSDIDAIKSVFKERLKAIYHTRISYPDDKNQ